MHILRKDIMRKTLSAALPALLTLTLVFNGTMAVLAAEDEPEKISGEMMQETTTDEPEETGSVKARENGSKETAGEKTPEDMPEKAGSGKSGENESEETASENAPEDESEETVQDETMEEEYGEDVQEDEPEEDLTPDIDIDLVFMPGSHIAVVSKNTKGDFWDRVHDGMEDAMKKINDFFTLSGDDKLTMTFEGPGDEKDVESQINTIDAVIAENPDVLCLCAGDMDSLQAQIEAASENGIPVVVFDSRVSDMSLVSSFISTDNQALGVMAGEKMAEALSGSGKVIAFCPQEKTSTSRERVEGFMSVLDTYEDIEVTEVIYDDQVEDMQEAMRESLANDPDINAVYCANDKMAEAYLSLRDKEDDQIIFIGTDGSRKQQEAVRDGVEYGFVSQNPYGMGYQTILAAVRLTDVDGRDNVSPELLIAPRWIDPSVIDDPENEDYLY